MKSLSKYSLNTSQCLELNLMNLMKTNLIMKSLTFFFSRLPALFSGWNDLQASMRSPVIAQPPHANPLASPASLPFGMPFSSDASSFLSGKSLSGGGGDYQQSPTLPSLSPMDNLSNLVYTPAVDPLELSASSPNYSFRKWFKKDLKKSLI